MVLGHAHRFWLGRGFTSVTLSHERATHGRSADGVRTLVAQSPTNLHRAVTLGRLGESTGNGDEVGR
jgi:hypothetical protein